MGVKYLKKGDPQPPPVEAGKLRLYSMLYCPFAHRARLVLDAKGIPFEMVDINLKMKPEWYSSVHPEAKVPALEMAGGEVVVESLDVADYVNRKFPEPPLWPSDAETLARGKKLLELFGKLHALFYMECIRAKDSQALKDILPNVAAALRPFEDELAKTGSKFFGGKRPGMVDYMIWPWAERCESLPALYPDVAFPTEDFPKLMTWGTAMKQDAAVKMSAMDVAAHVNYLKKYVEGSLDYDKL